MTTVTNTRRAIVASCLAVALPGLALAGDLNPPPGPVAPTMKPLDALAPGRCVTDLPGSADAVHVISEPGLYVLTRDLVAQPGKSAIAVEINPALPPGEYRVTIDLAGHSIEGVPTADAGVDFRHTTPGHKYVDTLTLRGPLTAGRIGGFDGPAIRCTGNADLHVSNLRVADCAGHGIECTNTGRVELDTVRVSSCALDGVHVNGASECRLACRVADCNGDGIEVLNTPVVRAGGGERKALCQWITEVVHCGGRGIALSQCNEIELSDSTVSDCSLHAIVVSTAVVAKMQRVEMARCLQNGLDALSVDRLTLADIEIIDCDGNGLEARSCPVVRYVAIKTKGTGADKNRVAGCGGHGVLLDQCGDVEVADLTVDQCVLDGVHVVNPVQCRLRCDVTACGGNGIDVTGGDIVAIGVLGLDGVDTRLPPPPPPKRVAACGGYGLRLADARACDVSSLRVDQCVLGGIRCDLTNPALTDTRVHVHACVVERCSGDALAVVSSASPPAVRVAQCAALHCAGDGLHVSGARSVNVIDWLDDDSDDDGIDIRSGPAAEPRVAVLRSSSSRAGSAGIRLHGAVQPIDAELVHVTVRDAAGNGIDARNNLQLGSLSIEHTRVSGCGDDGVFCDRQWLKLGDVHCDSNASRGFRLTNKGSFLGIDVHASNNGEEGMRVSDGGSGKVSLKDFSFTSNGSVAPGGADGLVIEAVSSITLRNGECTSNTGSGIRLADFDRDGLLDLVVCSSNGLHGVHAQSAGGLPLGRCRLTNSMCDSNSGDGVLLEATTGGEVARCTLTNNGGTGLSIFGNTHTVHANSLGANLGGALLVPVPGNIVGPLIDEPLLAGNCNPAANYVH